MISGKAHTNESFRLLYNSTEFLNQILNNITGSIILLNEKIELQAYNDAFKAIFTYSEGKDILYKKFGNVIGCAYNVDEEKECGKTSHCDACELREATLKSYINIEPITKMKFSRPFYNEKNQKVQKDLQDSTRFFKYNHDRYVIMIIEDLNCNKFFI